jgi:RNA-directed DNA polymerase
MENLYKKIISLDNLLLSWKEFRNGKRSKTDVREFELNLEDNLFELHEELTTMKYKHGNYSSFHITDPKQRHIHKAKVRDRIVHHAVHRILYPIFDEYFISGSYSCRLGKGSHRAVTKLQRMARKVSKNYTGHCYVLKCDIKKFFNSVDHQILFKILKHKINDPDLLSLIEEIIGSFGYDVGKQPQLQLFDFRGENREREREREREQPSAALG